MDQGLHTIFQCYGTGPSIQISIHGTPSLLHHIACGLQSILLYIIRSSDLESVHELNISMAITVKGEKFSDLIND